LNTLTDDQIVAEIVWTAKIVRDIIGQTPIHVRPPYGDTNSQVARVLGAMGLKVVKWSRDSNDYHFSFFDKGTQPGAPYAPTDTPDAIPRLFSTWTREAQTGTISLQHDIYAEVRDKLSTAIVFANFYN
jgi:peptidoglycan/xylan/chitin deacetylase (PgdA/CDA1 family)